MYFNDGYYHHHLQPLTHGRVTGKAAPTGDPKLPFPETHYPALTGGSRDVPRQV